MEEPRTLGEAVARNGACEAFIMLGELCLKKGLAPIKGKIVNFKIGDKWEIWMNGFMEKKEIKNGISMRPASAYVEYNGWPAAILDPAGGTIIDGHSVNEDEFIKIIKNELNLNAEE